MAVFAPGDPLPQGWIRFPDGSVGPPNQVGSDWNASFRQPVPPTPGGPASTVPGALAPSGSTQISTGGGPIPITDSTAAPPGGTSLNTTGPEPPGGSGDGGFNPFSLLRAIPNPYWRAAIAGADVMAPTPTANDAAPTNAWFQRPSGVGGMPGPQVTNPEQPDHPSTMRYPMWPTPPAPAAASSIPIGGGPGNVMEAPTGTPAAAPKGGGKKGRINPANVNLGRGAPGVTANASPFIGIDRPNADVTGHARGYNSGVQGTALDLSGLFNHPAVAAAAAAHPAVQGALARGALISKTTGKPMPMSTADAAANFHRNNAGNLVPGAPPPPPVMPPDIAAKRRGSTSSQSGGY